MKNLAQQLQQQMTSAAVGSLFEGAHRLGFMSAGSQHELYDTRVVRNIKYGEHPDQRLDVIIPNGVRGPMPVVFHVHGGAFTMLSKDSHHRIAETFARRGFLVINVGYRLAPKHTFPAAPEDVASAYLWAIKNAPAHGGDVDRLVLAGESAGANLVLGLALSATLRCEELFARRVFEAGVVPQAVVAFSGLLQLSREDRFGGILGMFAARELRRIRAAYLGGSSRTPELADPLCILEAQPAFQRPFPAVFAPGGSADPLSADSVRLETALREAGVVAEAPIYEGESHSFHAFMWRDNARRAWADAFAFLDELDQLRTNLAA